MDVRINMPRLSLRLLIATLTFTIGVAACALWLIYSHTKAQQVNPPSAATALPAVSEEYAVYSSLLSDRRYIEDQAKLVIIVEETRGYPEGYPDEEKERAWFDNYFKEKVPEFNQAAFSDYLSKSLEPQSLENRFKIKARVALVSAKEVREIFERHSTAGWNVLFKQYPGAQGLIELSRVGFNSDRTRAFVYLGISCGGTCGEGSFFLLRKENGEWIVQRKISAWVS